MIPDWPRRLAAITLALIALGLLPIVYRKHRIETTERQLQELRRTQQPLPRQLDALHALTEFGVSQLSTGENVKELRRQLEVRRGQCERQLRQPDSELVLSPEQQTQRQFDKGLNLYLLDRLAEAEPALLEIAPSHLRASLLLAVVLQDEKRWPHSDRWFEHTMKLGAESPDANLGVLARSQAIDGLASNARQERRYADAVTAYRRGIEEIPQARPYFHYQLGRHFADGGRASEALAELRIAQELDESHIGKKAAKLIAELRRSTPGCVVRAR